MKSQIGVIRGQIDQLAQQVAAFHVYIQHLVLNPKINNRLSELILQRIICICSTAGNSCCHRS